MLYIHTYIAHTHIFDRKKIHFTFKSEKGKDSKIQHDGGISGNIIQGYKGDKRRVNSMWMTDYIM